MLQSTSAASRLTLVPDRPRTGDRPRVLLVRSCRPAQFAAAVAAIRARAPHAEIVALTHAHQRQAAAAPGVDRILEIRGRRFGLLRTSSSLPRLRRERFEEVVIPQMTPHASGHGNLYRMAAAIGAPRVTVIPGHEPAQTFDAAGFRRKVLRQIRHDIAGLFQSPVLLIALLVAACATPRRRRAPRERVRVLHIISSLGVGGAQRQLAELLARTPPDRYDVEVLVLGRADGDFSRQWFTREAVRVTYLSEWPRLVSSVLEVRRHCRAGAYDVVHTWLFMANVIGVAGARLARAPRVIASVRNLSLWKRTWYRQWWLRIADALCSRGADVVTVNAEALTADHARWAWYPASRIAVVHNGLDPCQFLVDRREARSRLLDISGFADGSVIVGTVGRLAPEKDHLTFLRMLQRLRRERPDVRGVIVGDGQLRAALHSAAREYGLDDAVAFVGERHDARTLMAGFDLFVLTSTIEGFPNVLLEAALLGIPAVASAVGGSPDVLGCADHTFAAGDDAAAARQASSVIAAPGEAAARAEATRRRALTLFTADRTASRWFALYAGTGVAEETVFTRRNGGTE